MGAPCCLHAREGPDSPPLACLHSPSAHGVKCSQHQRRPDPAGLAKVQEEVGLQGRVPPAAAQLDISRCAAVATSVSLIAGWLLAYQPSCSPTCPPACLPADRAVACLSACLPTRLPA